MDKEITCESLENTYFEEVPISIKEYNELSNIQQSILSMLASHSQTQTILDKLCSLAESLLPNSVSSIMLMDEKTQLMSVVSAPSVPEVGHKALENLKPGPGGGSCGNAVFTNEAQYVQNTFEDKRWTDLRQIAYDFNLCSCWSMPVRDQYGKAIGSFALSSFEHRQPSAFHKMVLETGASIVSIVLKNQKNKDKLQFLAYHDVLTKLHNKAYYEEITSNKKQRSLILLNVDNFSYINTAYGFDIADKLLIKISHILKTEFNANYIFKLNSDEFALMYEKEINLEDKILKIQKYFLSNSIQIDDLKLNISFSYGAVFGNSHLLRNSSSALKHAKENGKNRFYIYNEKEDSFNYENKESIVETSNLVRNAIEKDQIIPFFQGIYDNNKHEITKYEALVRIKKNDEIISPYFFLEAAKLSGLLPDITKIMIEKSLKHIQNKNINISLNITEDDLSQNYLTSYLKEKLSQYNINAKQVTLEILEGVSATGKKNHIKQLNELKQIGLNIAIDDFGTEYSNFERILDLDVDSIKIDAKYIKNIHTNKRSYEITRALVFFAKNVNISCTAEFVHNEEVQKIIEELEIDFSQGYFFSEPSEQIE